MQAAIVVVDAAGHLMGTLRFEEALWITPEIAHQGPYGGIGKGAVPIVIDGAVVGAVGVSGGIPADLDHAIAEAAVRTE